MPSSPQPVSPRWKGLLADLSLALAGFIWLSGLMDSLSRPSVAPALSLQQQELTLLAEPAVPPPLRDALLGESSRDALLKALEGISPEERNASTVAITDATVALELVRALIRGDMVARLIL